MIKLKEISNCQFFNNCCAIPSTEVAILMVFTFIIFFPKSCDAFHLIGLIRFSVFDINSIWKLSFDDIGMFLLA